MKNSLKKKSLLSLLSCETVDFYLVGIMYISFSITRTK